MSTPSLFSAGVLAGAYRGGGLDRTLLSHAVSDAPVTLGRLKRAAGQAFCRPSLDMVDQGAWQQDAGTVTCPTCATILAAKGLR